MLRWSTYPTSRDSTARRRAGRRLFDDGDPPYHLKVTTAEVFPTGVIRVLYAPTEAPAR